MYYYYHHHFTIDNLRHRKDSSLLRSLNWQVAKQGFEHSHPDSLAMLLMLKICLSRKHFQISSHDKLYHKPPKIRETGCYTYIDHMLPSNKCATSSLVLKKKEKKKEKNGSGLNSPGSLGGSRTPDSIFILV